jgi:glycosyltransferase involved in cell wall biosynthesis
MPGIVRPEPDTVMVLDPSFYKFQAKKNAAMALLGKGDVELAMKYFQEAKKASPNDEGIKAYESVFVEALEMDKYVKNLMWMSLFLRDKEPKKILDLISSIPQNFYKDERVWSIRNMFITPKTWKDDEVVIYCGKAWEDWNPTSVLKGIGGSEEAVIYLSKELVKLGYKVTVFNSCGDSEGVFDGVTYKPFFAFNPKDSYNILIGWRQNYLTGLKAKKKLIWMHDVPSQGMFTEENIKDIDKIIVLSEYHKILLPSFIQQDKIFVSSNGINLSDFQGNGVLRNPKRLIYTSSYDRGIQHLLLMWPEIKQAVPDAELHLFYGWNTYDEMVKAGARDPKFKNGMLELMAQEGVFEHGRVGHQQLVKEFQRSGIWVYPSHFEEISCISAMKAQAAGCVPVCTDYAALLETVKVGIKVGGRCGNERTNQQLKKELINVLQDEAWQEEVRKEVLNHKDEFGWDKVAQQWHTQLFSPQEVFV